MRASSMPPTPLALTQWRDEIVVQRHLQPRQFDLLVGRLGALHHGFDGAVRILDGVDDALDRCLDEAGHHFGILLGEVRVHHDGVAVHDDAVVRHQHHLDVFLGEALGEQIEIGREGEAGDGIDLAVGEHRLAHREADILDLHLAGVDAVLLGEGGPLRIGAIRRGGAEHFAFQILRRVDVATW